jgi:hypothetical protein
MVDKTLNSLTALQGQSYVPDWLHDVMSLKRGMYNGVVTPTLEAKANNFDSYFYKDYKQTEPL